MHTAGITRGAGSRAGPNPGFQKRPSWEHVLLRAPLATPGPLEAHLVNTTMAPCAPPYRLKAWRLRGVHEFRSLLGLGAPSPGRADGHVQPQVLWALFTDAHLLSASGRVSVQSLCTSMMETTNEERKRGVCAGSRDRWTWAARGQGQAGSPGWRGPEDETSASLDTVARLGKCLPGPRESRSLPELSSPMHAPRPARVPQRLGTESLQ